MGAATSTFAADRAPRAADGRQTFTAGPRRSWKGRLRDAQRDGGRRRRRRLPPSQHGASELAQRATRGRDARAQRIKVCSRWKTASTPVAAPAATDNGKLRSGAHIRGKHPAAGSRVGRGRISPLKRSISRTEIFNHVSNPSVRSGVRAGRHSADSAAAQRGSCRRRRPQTGWAARGGGEPGGGRRRRRVRHELRAARGRSPSAEGGARNRRRARARQRADRRPPPMRSRRAAPCRSRSRRRAARRA